MIPVFELKKFYQVHDQEPDLLQPAAGHFNIFRMEDLTGSEDKPVSYSRRDFFKISLVKAEGNIHYADRTVEARGTVLAFTNPMIPFFWERTGAKQTGFVCIFTEAFFNRYGSVRDCPVFRNKDNGVMLLSPAEEFQFKALFEKIYSELTGDYEFKYDLLRSLVMEVIHTAQKKWPLQVNKTDPSKASERIAIKFRDLLEQQFPIELNRRSIRLRSARDFAGALNVQVNHLNKVLKTMTGQTTMQLINDRVIQEAGQLLKGTTWSVSEIARCLGFEEPNHFSAFFKSRSKFTPNQFRQLKKD
ncbi:AraC-type DNA-binding protein [Pedobacter westerhofensis]|uniref:AraC-type DNA-binding protein n=2 Tax=Pedobacter westerhofensis TaxID=425512 RepID=A0A521BPV2_9SPHI|nr:AraC-type DNA-binding protein [Pedobacter westerhofensis]